ncbi:MAG: hypothetical protein LBB08_03035 [Rickettsiales bacterium]|jgi:hypothetical protein|nr:hypothetical protein [Rickettsiales bacterium]
MKKIFIMLMLAACAKSAKDTETYNCSRCGYYCVNEKNPICCFENGAALRKIDAETYVLETKEVAYENEKPRASDELQSSLIFYKVEKNRYSTKRGADFDDYTLVFDGHVAEYNDSPDSGGECRLAE